jgi:hypothetical protein
MYKVGLITVILLLSMMDVAFAEYKAGMAGNPFSGAKWGKTTCPSGSYAVGLRVSGGQFVEYIGLQCLRVRDGKILNMAGLSSSDPVGQMFAPPPRRAVVFCRGSRRLAGIKFKSGSYVDRVASIRCQNRNGGDTEYLGVGIGGTGGTYVRAYCRTGDHVTSIGGHAGRWIDHANVYCD